MPIERAENTGTVLHGTVQSIRKTRNTVHRVMVAIDRGEKA